MPRCPSCWRRVAAGASCVPDRWVAPASGSELEVPPEIPGLAIKRLLGYGGFASVWAAERGGEALALKLAHRAYVMVNGVITMSGTGKELLARPEIRTAYLEGGRH